MSGCKPPFAVTSTAPGAQPSGETSNEQNSKVVHAPSDRLAQDLTNRRRHPSRASDARSAAVGDPAGVFPPPQHAAAVVVGPAIRSSSAPLGVRPFDRSVT